MRFDLREIMDLAEKGGFAVPAFNVYNMETVLGVMQASEQANAPVMFMMYSSLFDSMEGKLLSAIIREAVDTMKTPAVFHLDHGAGVPQVMRALRWGASGVMIDASACPLEENIATSAAVVKMAKAVGVSVEGELGHIGMASDGVGSDYTRVDEAVRYVEETGVDALAIMVGTAHGHYKKAPVLAIDRIRQIHAATDVHLVLHGGSGVPDDQVRAAVEAGIRKMNFGTDLCCAYMNTLHAGDPALTLVTAAMEKPTQAVKEYALSKISLLGAGK